jgi:putative phosphoesterase
MQIGVISDTHGLVRPEALRALRGCDRIVHAGDVGGPEVLDALEAIAPVTAVRGNVDRGAWADALPATEVVEAGPQLLYVLHAVQELEIDPAAGGFAAVISGHSHRPGAEVREGVLYLNPGSAGPRRFTLPVAVARLHVRGARLEPEIVELDVAPPRRR